MGGLVNITIRDNSGEVYPMSRWTNVTEHIIDNLGFVEKSKDHFDETIGDYQEMKQDYEENKDTGNFKHRMSLVYGDCVGVAPEGYGLIVMDYKENKIRHFQGYTSYGCFSSSSLHLDIMGNVIGGTIMDRFKEFYNAGRVMYGSPWRRKNTNKNNIKKIDTSLDFDDFIQKYVVDLNQKYLDAGSTIPIKDRLQYFITDMSPFEIVRYEENTKDMLQMKQDLEDDGFRFGQREETAWDEYVYK